MGGGRRGAAAHGRRRGRAGGDRCRISDRGKEFVDRGVVEQQRHRRAWEDTAGRSARACSSLKEGAGRTPHSTTAGVAWGSNCPSRGPAVAAGPAVVVHWGILARSSRVKLMFHVEHWLRVSAPERALPTRRVAASPGTPTRRGSDPGRAPLAQHLIRRAVGHYRRRPAPYRAGRGRSDGHGPGTPRAAR